MSLLILKDREGIDLYNDVLQDTIKDRLKRLARKKIKFLNGCEKCLVCGNDQTVNDETQIIEPLIRHHVSYFPQVVTYVHYECHKKIHDPTNPITNLIQYDEGDSEKFYHLQKQLQMMRMVAITNC